LINEEGQIVLFSDLASAVNKFQENISQLGLEKQNSTIAIWTEKSVNAIVMIQAILSSGNGYIPINNDWPSDRVKFILENTGTATLIVDENRCSIASDLLNEMGVQFTMVRIDGNFYLFSFKSIRKIRLPKALSYILFTSGSTGYPKGIVHTHESAFTFLKWCLKEFKSYKIKRHVSIAPLNFDLSVFDVFYPLVNTSTLFVPASSIMSNTRLFAKYVNDQKIESLYTTPSYLNLLEQTGKLSAYDFKHVKLILIAGEALSSDLVKRLKVHFKKATFYNLYGPTETNVCSAFKIDLKKLSGEYIPIGKSIIKGNIKLSKQGELLYKGKLLMSGYINDKGYQALRRNSVYKTGDFVTCDKNGLLNFIGRKDNLVKRNGFRIELNEINKALQKHSSIGRCESLFIKEDSQIVSFVESADDLSQLALKSFCLSHLPSYMVPDLIMVLRKIPVNLNHKVDQTALRKMYAQSFKS